MGYDPMGRLYQVAQGSSTTRMGYDGLDRIAEYDGSNAILRRYIHGPGVDNPIAAYEGTGTTNRSFLSTDERGSIITLTDSSGTLLNLNKYDEYGVPQSGNSGKFGYTGQAWVPEVGLWYYKARFMRPDIGRFMQTDPIGYEAGSNIYTYVLNDPINSIDPLGLDEEGGEQVGPIVGVRTPCEGICFSVSLTGFGGPGLPFWLKHLEDIGAPDRENQCKEALNEADKDDKAVERAKRNWGILSHAARSHSLPTSFLAAIGIRESGFMPLREIGGGPGVGVFQLTVGPGSRVNFNQAMNLTWSANFAANMLQSNMAILDTRFSFTATELLQATAASYNFGVDDISGNPATIDVGTTGNNYGSNVVDLMSCFEGQ